MLQMCEMCINYADQMTLWRFWMRPNFMDLLAWPKCLNGCFRQDQMPTNHKRERETDRQTETEQVQILPYLRNIHSSLTYRFQYFIGVG